MTTIFRISVWPKQSEMTKAGQSLVEAAHQLGYTGMQSCLPGSLYFVEGKLDQSAAQALADAILADPVTETVTVKQLSGIQESVAVGLTADQQHIDVTLLPGVTDPAAANLAQIAQRLGYSVTRAATGQQYKVTTQLGAKDLEILTHQLFCNPVVQQASINQAITPPFFDHQKSDGYVESISLTEATDDELEAISQERRLSMNLAEMQAIRTYFRDEGREPTDLELEMLAQTWSEHCVHKTFKAIIDYTGPDGKTEEVDGILNQYIRAATEKIDKPWVKSSFVDNAGIVAFTPEHDLAFKVETHNHPSALEPFGGANTGVGGVIRDVLGVSARPIANTDVLCFGNQDLDQSTLPEGVLHPQRIQAGVIDGIEDYGNKMGIPTVNGAIFYHDGYTANPLVYVGCLGILPVDSNPTQSSAGDLIVALGGRTGRDGLRGATFSSMEMDTSTSEIAGTAVQIGHPIMEKQVQEVILQARDEQLYTAITDCGAGGFSSAVGEMSEKLGARIQLQNIPLKYPGLRPWEIWLSEAQERMVIAVHPSKYDRLCEICATQDVEPTILGEFTGDKRLQVFYGDRLVGDLAEQFLHDGLPRRRMQAEWTSPAPIMETKETNSAENTISASEALLKLLAHPNIRSREETIRRYDHEVQAATAVKPLVGVANQGPSDGAVLVPLDSQLEMVSNDNDRPLKAASLSNGLCPQFAAIDPYNMAWAAIDEAVRNAVAVGADPEQISILDNFCWGNPNLPDRLGALVRCAQGCYDAAVTYGTPYISGKDSLNNEYTGADGEKHAIPGTLLVSALGIVPNINNASTMDFKGPDQAIYMLGNTRSELAGSHYAEVANLASNSSKSPAPAEAAMATFKALHATIANGLTSAVHDCSEGGVAVALAEMALAAQLGANVGISNLPTADTISDTDKLFSESLSRFIVTVEKENQAAFEATLSRNDVPFAHIGQTTTGTHLIFTDAAGETLMDLPITALDKAFRGHVGNVSQSRPAPIAADGANTKPAITAAPALQARPRVLILHANGTNRDRDAALACQLAGGDPEIVHINQLAAGQRQLSDYNMLLVPGGFSYGDDLGAGILWAADLRVLLGDQLAKFVADGRPVFGICNGFQVLVKSGLLTDPTDSTIGDQRPFTLTYNHSARFECRWTVLEPNQNSHCLFTNGLTEPIYCPVAHGEGRFSVNGQAMYDKLAAENRIVLTYAESEYPANPNGSIGNIAGICNTQGNVMGLMPHPEDHIFGWQHPRYQNGSQGMLGLSLFQNGIRNA